MSACGLADRQRCERGCANVFRYTNAPQIMTNTGITKALRSHTYQTRRKALVREQMLAVELVKDAGNLVRVVALPDVAH